MVLRILMTLSVLTCHVAFAQYFSKEQELIAKINQSHSEIEHVRALGDLAEFYYVFRADTKGDSVLQKQLLLAELTRNSDLIFETLAGKAITNIPSWSDSTAFDYALIFLEKGLAYARETGNQELEALAYCRKSLILRKKGELDAALQQCTLAQTASSQIQNDSVKVAIYLETGDVFLAKKDFESACRQYNTAFDVAYLSENKFLQSDVYHRLSILYQSLGDTEEAKNNLLQSVQLNLDGNNIGLMKDYFDLARITDQREYIDKLLDLADRNNSYYYRYKGETVMLAYLMVIKKNSKEALDYLNSHEGLQQSFRNQGASSDYWNVGYIFSYAGQIDSAIKYFTLAVPDLENTYDVNIRKRMYYDLGNCYYRLSDKQKALFYFEKAMALNEQKKDFENSKNISIKLSTLYADAGNYKKAFEYDRKHIFYSDTIQSMKDEKKLTLMKVARENKKHERDLAALASENLRNRNLQYFGIAIAISAFFAVLLLMGMFPMSRLTINLLSFMGFVCLFEFIVLLIDNYLHRITHGAPFKIWLIKIFLIAALVPVQHFLEHALERFLSSQRLLKMRQQFSIKRLWNKKVVKQKSPPPSGSGGLEDNTAVL